MNNYIYNKYGKAIGEYTDGYFSLGKASEMKGMPKRLFMYELHEMGIPLNLGK